MTALLHDRPTAEPSPEVTAGPTLILEIHDAGDPERLGRIMSCLVNNSPMALTAVDVRGVRAYPVASPPLPASDHREARLTMRDRSQAVDQLIADEVVARVAARYRVVATRRDT
jgi:hypothetical protein